MDQPEHDPAAASDQDSLSAKPDETDETHETGEAVEVVVVSPDGGQSAGYAMYEASDLSVDGAVLRGGLLLELAEEVTMELQLPERAAVRVRARVIEILRDRGPAMRVTFAGLEETERQRLSRFLSS